MTQLEDVSPEQWRDLDAAGAGERATTYLDAAASVIARPRLRSHELLGVGPGGVVLDVGCGTAIALREIADIVGPEGTVVGLDPSAAMLEEAGRRLEGAPARVELVEGTATATGLDGDRFDAVRTERVLMHVPELGLALTELARVTRPGGRIVLVEPDHRRLAFDTDEPDLWIRIVKVFAMMLANISAGLRAPAEATTLGLDVTHIEPMPFMMRTKAVFDEVFQLEPARDAILAEGITAAEFDGLLDEMTRRDREGRFLAVGMMYVVVLGVPA